MHSELNLILEQRAKTHGDFTHVAEKAQLLKAVMRDSINWKVLKQEGKESCEMIASKLARILCRNPTEPDHWRDIAGYAMLVANRLEAEK